MMIVMMFEVDGCCDVGIGMGGLFFFCKKKKGGNGDSGSGGDRGGCYQRQ